MDPSASLLSVLPNLSIGVISVLLFGYTALQFLKIFDNRVEKHDRAMAEYAEKHAAAMNEREKAIRDLEAHVRNMLANSLTQASIALEQNTRVLTRIIHKLDGEK